MRKLVYSSCYRKKLSEIKKYLDIQFGEKLRKKILREITDRLHQLQKHAESGVSIKELYGINTEYRYVFVAHNYVFYRIDTDSVYIVNIYNEREDYMMKLFTITREMEEY